VRLASYNVENLTDATDGATSLTARIEILAPQLERLAADIICFQEVDATRSAPGEPRALTALTRLLEAAGYADFHLAHTTHSSSGGPRDKHNLVVASRWPIRQVGQYANDLVPAPHYAAVTAGPSSTPSPKPASHAGKDAVLWDRPILHVEVALPEGRMLHLLNLHLKSPQASYIAGQKTGPFAWKTVSGWAEGYFLATIKQAGQALEARMLVDRLFDGDADSLIAVVGDFNAEEGDAPFRILKGDVEDTGNGRLAARALVPLEHSLPDSQRFTVIHRGRKLMLDHLLASRRLLARYRHIEIHNEALGDELVGATLVDAPPDSYHAPIVAAFDMSGRQDGL